MKMSSMKEKLSSMKREVLVEMVKLAQKRGFKGSKGGWKEFLNFYDKKIGASVSDPARRATEALLAFLNTFGQEDALKFFDQVLRCYSNREAVEQFQKTCPDTESPEQKLVRFTLEHPQYPIDYSFPSHEEGWLVMKRRNNRKAMRSTTMVAIDCEMVLCEDGSEALVRLCAVDHNLEVKLDEFVKPDKAIVDYRTEITGITAEHLKGVNSSLVNLQKSMKKLLSQGTILVGHSLNNDLQVLKLDHARVIDTSYLFMSGDGASSRKLSLSNLCKSVLGYELRKQGSPHNCLDDACAAMKLVLCKIERGVDAVIPVVSNEEQEMDLEKLLVHRIPVKVCAEDLHEIIPGEFTIEVKATRKRRGDTYNALVIFEDEQEARTTFDILEGNEEKDSVGRSQKKIHFQLSNGVAGSLRVCKMASDLSSQNMSRKRSFQHDEAMDDTKKPRTEDDVGKCEEIGAETNQCENHLKEIERLKREISQRDQEISSLNKIIVALTRKQGL